MSTASPADNLASAAQYAHAVNQVTAVSLDVVQRASQLKLPMSADCWRRSLGAWAARHGRRLKATFSAINSRWGFGSRAMQNRSMQLVISSGYGAHFLQSPQHWTMQCPRCNIRSKCCTAFGFTSLRISNRALKMQICV